MTWHDLRLAVYVYFVVSRQGVWHVYRDRLAPTACIVHVPIRSEHGLFVTLE